MNFCLILSLSLVWLGAFAAQADEIVNNPPAARFLRRTHHATIVVGDHLYIDGGEISQLVDGIPTSGQGSWSDSDSHFDYAPGAHQNNVTLSIDLGKSWTNSSVEIRTITKDGAPVLNDEDLWRDSDGKSFIVWGGSVSELARRNSGRIPSIDIWRFTTDADGGGNWTQEGLETFKTSPNAPKLGRPYQGCSSSVGQTHYYVGGIVDQNSDPAISQQNGYFPMKITSLNSSSGEWNGEANINLNSQGTTLGARAVTVPAFGLDDRGLMVIMGGLDPGQNLSLGSSLAQEDTSFTKFDNITLYDPYIDRWYTQTATGDIPAARKWFCAVSVKGDNGTYEIFIYGGIVVTSWRAYGDVYVLSIPGFFWSKAENAASVPRYWHSCEHAKGDQLITIGGIDNPEGSDGEWNIWGNQKVQDPFTQGIGVFNMASMQWQSSYDANAPPYRSPDGVKSWYSSGSLASVEWQSLELARMFIRDTPVVVNPTPAAELPAEATAEQRSNSKEEKIALGVGIGLGVPALIAALVSAWFAWKMYRMKREKRPKKAAKGSSSSTGSSGVALDALEPQSAPPPTQTVTDSSSQLKPQSASQTVSESQAQPASTIAPDTAANPPAAKDASTVV